MWNKLIYGIKHLNNSTYVHGPDIICQTTRATIMRVAGSMPIDTNLSVYVCKTPKSRFAFPFFSGCGGVIVVGETHTHLLFAVWLSLLLAPTAPAYTRRMMLLDANCCRTRIIILCVQDQVIGLSSPCKSQCCTIYIYIFSMYLGWTCMSTVLGVWRHDKLTRRRRLHH